MLQYTIILISSMTKYSFKSSLKNQNDIWSVRRKYAVIFFSPFYKIRDAICNWCSIEGRNVSIYIHYCDKFGICFASLIDWYDLRSSLSLADVLGGASSFSSDVSTIVLKFLSALSSSYIGNCGFAIGKFIGLHVEQKMSLSTVLFQFKKICTISKH